MRIATRSLIVCSLAGLIGAATPASRSSIVVRDAASLKAAIAAARGGETILLAPGDYGDVVVAKHQFAKPLTIQSKDNGDPARFERLEIVSSSNIIVRQVDVGGPLRPGEKDFTAIVRISGADHIRLEKLAVHGSLNGDPEDDGRGAVVVQSQAVTISGSSFRELRVGAVFDKCRSVELSGNSFEDMRSDGTDVADSWGVRVLGNRFSDFHPRQGDHPDAIQFWMTGKGIGSGDIVIRDNVILQGSGVGPQGIFVSDARDGKYTGVEISNNLVYSNDHYLGIYVSGAVAPRISGNTTLSAPKDGKYLRIAVARSDSPSIESNVAEQIDVDNKVMSSGGSNMIVDRDRSTNKLSLLDAHGSPKGISALMVNGKGYRPPDVPGS
ncbi:right-handed parallel beta-helix repeat-containing protein [Sphingomonas changbaiensis]|nr:right-handed parallel beta-helix repeat-containing protein [Sphingomonas changbaiensis]